MKQSGFSKYIFALCFFFCLLLPQAVFSQDFSSIDNDLQTLENLITDTILSMEEQQRLLEDLKTNLIENEILIGSYESIIQGQENLLRDLQVRLNEMSEIYRTQSALSAKYERSSRFWRTFTLIAIPVTAIVSGSIVWAVVR